MIIPYGYLSLVSLTSNIWNKNLGLGCFFFFLEVIPKKLRGREGEGEKANKQGVGNWGSILLGAFSEKLEHVSELVP